MKYILGISDSHDAGAALIDMDGNIICAINEERLSREKLHTGMPYLAIKEIFKRTGVSPADIEQVSLATIDFAWTMMFGSNFFKMRDGLSRGNWLSVIWDIIFRPAAALYRTKFTVALGQLWRPKKRKLEKFLRGLGVQVPVTLVEHHTAHAASAYYTGKYSRSLIITMDTNGDTICTTVGIGENGVMKRIFSQQWPDNATNLYTRATQLLGFLPIRHEGKTLGLAAHGNPELLAEKFRKLVSYDPATNTISGHRMLGNYSGGTRFLRTICSGHKREDIAAAVQRVAEEVTLAFVKDWVEKTGVRDIVAAGGLFANVRINQKILEMPGVHSFFVHPHMGDGGLALGSALYSLAQKRTLLPKPLENVYLGFQYTNSEIEETAKNYGLKYRTVADLPKFIASLLKDRKIVGLYQGRMEYGPRALGNRTILANPSDHEINNRLNKRLNRTEFMPFAPVVCEEEAAACFKIPDEGEYPAKFMTITYDALPECKELAPAICHVDGTARPQIVDRENNPLYYDILKEFYKVSGIPVLVNTSFNMHEEPIVASPDDAIRSFLVGAVDVLVLQDYVIEKQPA